MHDDQLSLLSKPIAVHAREAAGREWQDEHRPVLLAILAHAGLGKLDDDILALRGKEIPIKAIVNAIHEQFLDVRTKELMQALANKAEGLVQIAPVARIAPDKRLTANEVAEMLGLDRDTIYKWARSGRIPCIKLRHRLRFRLGDIERWEKQQTVGKF
jgi:excisionase family DNA binding protein